jgi:hypothetical protein
MDKKAKSHLRKAVEVIEEAGFHVDRAYEEDFRDAGNPTYDSAFSPKQNDKTGAIILRITPKPSAIALLGV